MTSLTGEGSEAFGLSSALGETDEFWHKLEYYVEEAFLMGCSIEGVGEHDNGRGLLTGHAYGIVNCRITRRDRVRLLQIFNPWGMKARERAQRKKKRRRRSCSDVFFLTRVKKKETKKKVVFDLLWEQNGRGRGATARPSGRPS